MPGVCVSGGPGRRLFQGKKEQRGHEVFRFLWLSGCQSGIGSGRRLTTQGKLCGFRDTKLSVDPLRNSMQLSVTEPW